ncbi:MAG: hypothetical protein Kow00109_09000 [Acidobacteriota bacterium]
MPRNMECDPKAKPHRRFGCPWLGRPAVGGWDIQSGGAGPAALCRRTPQAADREGSRIAAGRFQPRRPWSAGSSEFRAYRDSPGFLPQTNADHAVVAAEEHRLAPAAFGWRCRRKRTGIDALLPPTSYLLTPNSYLLTPNS